MANRTVLLCLVLSISLTFYIDSVLGSPKRGGWNSRPSRPSSSSSGSSWSKPSSSSGSSWSSWNSKPSYPSSGGLSGHGSSKPSYPSSSTGLSGSGTSWSPWSSKPSYPSSGSGLSGHGSGSNQPSYPSSGSGLSGSGSSKPSYPSGSGLSGYGSGSNKPSYPSSSTGLSGSGSGSGSSSGSGWSWWGSSSSSSGTGSGSHSYPSSSGGLSGSGTRPSYGQSSVPAGVDSVWNNRHTTPPSHINHNYGNYYGTHHATNNKYGNNYATPGHHGYSGTHVVNNHVTNVYHPHPYFSSPQYVYVTEYRNSGSRYGDILTGLALYNLGRSHSHYHDHYYHDDYYRRQTSLDGNMNGNYSPQNAAVCTMRITENGRVEILKIPCAIVSTFTNDGKQVTIPESQVNTTVCVTNSTVVNSASPVNVSSAVESNVTMANSTISSNSSTVGDAVSSNTTINSTISSNVTTCSFTVNATDPIKVKGPPLNASNMECEVEIRTRELRTINKVNCDTLMRYSKMPEPTKSEDIILPERQKLKKLLNNPPWWMSLFIAV